MAGIFPPSDKGGRPPGGNVCNGFSPTQPVIGEGPLYVAGDCSTVLTDCNFNSIISEILAAVDKLGIPFNANRVDNLGDALLTTFNLKVNKAGDTMLGPLMLWRHPVEPMEAATKQYVDDGDAALDQAKVNRAGDTMLGPLILADDPTSPLGAVTRRMLDALAFEVQGKVNRSGDTMTGVLTLAADPVLPMQAATRQYVDANAIGDAPADGRVFGRQDNAWVQIVTGGGGGGIGEAPATGDLFLRNGQTQSWVAYTGGNGNGGGDGDFLPLTGGTLTGFLTLHADPTQDLQAATKAYVDQHASSGGGSEFPAETGILFHQSAAPPGWTKVTTFNDAALRVVSGNIGWGGVLGFSTVFARQATDNFTLATAQMPAHSHANYDSGHAHSVYDPAHNHVVNDPTHVHSATYPSASSAQAPSGNPVSIPGAYGGNTGAAGTGIWLNGAYTGIGVNAANAQIVNANTGGGGAHAHGIDLRLQYVDVIICTKDAAAGGVAVAR